MRPLLTFFVLLSSLAAILSGCAPRSQDTGIDARIRYYRDRLGGRSTYPAYARLGLAHAERARITGSVDDSLDAVRYLQRSLSMQRNYEALLGLSAVSLALHRFPEALAYAREAVDTAPDDPAAHGALFDALLASGDDRGAEQALGRMEAETETEFAVLIRRGALLEYRGATAEALRDVERACEQSPKEPALTRAWCEVRIGALQLEMCEPQKARDSYARAASLVPGYLFAEEHLAELDTAEGHTSRAVGFYESRAAIDPRYRLALADLYDAGGQPESAAEQRRLARGELLERARLDVRDAWHELALLEAADVATAGDAVHWAEKDWRNRKDVHAADALAWAWSQQGSASKAEAALEQLPASVAASPTTILHAAVIRSRSGRNEEARALLERALVCPVALTPQESALARDVASRLAMRH